MTGKLFTNFSFHICQCFDEAHIQLFHLLQELTLFIEEAYPIRCTKCQNVF